MPRLRNKREIVDRKALGTALLATESRADVLALLKQALAAGRAEIKRRFEAGADGPLTATATAFLIDQLIASIHAYAGDSVYPEPNPTATDRLALVAVGGYGRGEMAPYSDIDVLFLLPYKQTPRGEQIVEYVLYLLWDLGLKVGQATRSIDECIVRANTDLTIRTAMLESRFVHGDQSLYLELRKRFSDEVVKGSGPAFVTAKLAERDERHQRMGDSRYVVEPNIKEGKGGLRDLHTLFWIAKYLYGVADVGELVTRGILTAAELRMFQRAHRFLWTVRCHMHYLMERSEERLTFDLQTELATVMRYHRREGSESVERFMKHYYLIAKTVGDLTRIFCAAFEAENAPPARQWLPRFGGRSRELEGFKLEHGRLSVLSDDIFETEPVCMVRLFHLAQSRDLDIHPHALMLITRSLSRINAKLRADEEANRLFVEMLTSEKDPEITLRRMNEAGVLGRFIPAFGRVVAQTQHDMYHVFTVDEHTIFAIGILSRIERGEIGDELPLASEIVHKVLSRKVLYLAVFLHDIGKGRGGSHSEIGARIARKLAPRLGYSAEETDSVAWLVEHHLLCSSSAFNRDISDPRTVSDFIDIVRSPERLRMLLVLTVADIRAVGPNVWNGWKGQLLRGLYYRAEAAMTGGDSLADQADRLAMAQDAFRAAVSDWPEEDVRAFVERAYPSYWLNFNTEVHKRHAEMIREADREGRTLAVDTRVDEFRSVTEVTIYAPAHPGLFAGIAGAMTVAGASVVDARIFTTTDGMALDTLWVQSEAGKAVDEPERLTKLAATVEMTLAADFKPAIRLEERERSGLSQRTAVFKVQPRVLVDNRASAAFTLLEINARDRVGLLYDIAQVLTDLRLSVGSAQINTYGEVAVDVFYVKDVFGMKIHDEARIEAIRSALIEAINSGEKAARQGGPAGIAAE